MEGMNFTEFCQKWFSKYSVEEDSVIQNAVPSSGGEFHFSIKVYDVRLSLYITQILGSPAINIFIGDSDAEKALAYTLGLAFTLDGISLISFSTPVTELAKQLTKTETMPYGEYLSTYLPTGLADEIKCDPVAYISISSKKVFQYGQNSLIVEQYIAREYARTLIA